MSLEDKDVDTLNNEELDQNTDTNVDTDNTDTGTDDLDSVDDSEVESDIDSDTNSDVPMGEASLVGSVYGLYDSDNNLVDNL